MKYRLGYALLPLTLLASLFFISPAKAAAQSTTDCPAPTITKTVSHGGSKIKLVKGSFDPETLDSYVQVGKADRTSLSYIDEDDPDKRRYYYVAEIALLWQASVPCSGLDSYIAEMEITCYRRNPTTNAIALNKCYFDQEYLALWYSPSSGGWFNPWGYHKYVRGNDFGCSAANGSHTIADSDYARAKMVVHMGFRHYDTEAVIYWTAIRAMTSYWVQTGRVVGSDELTGVLGLSPYPATYTAGPDLC